MPNIFITANWIGKKREMVHRDESENILVLIIFQIFAWSLNVHIFAYIARNKTFYKATCHVQLESFFMKS